MTDTPLPTDDPIAATRLWLERIVIGLNLCPFAKAVYVKDQVRIVLSDATTPEALVEELAEELVLLTDRKFNRMRPSMARTDRKFNRMRPSMARVLGLETRSAKEG